MMSFDEIFDLTAGVYFNFYNNICMCVVISVVVAVASPAVAQHVRTRGGGVRYARRPYY